ncbi:GH25 family lysozyme [Corynebacterium striatum]|uniref:GH25 family lysozyme n=1 Tax=Corynebacterium striatum TaxID=43770 RepID=UPI00141963B0|nr:GH25 family lysozyme [Corynebacterium striatum]NHX52962.1 peptidase M23 [Corynebacterium striatum]NHY37574.1 peptidase M23 [Corynebacterium striatum]HAT1133771.1 peptidoglycan DD-metalloendopeptidase family protein [Corynebacterium striatum]HAT1241325.1 peptidoglycan DD-metalloendopeptidase family protein [Corynebacterium striatum]HAT1246394.1 peptidoglycan DD-metalloendopeptidase family protein [Corynebacterium striatum]
MVTMPVDKGFVVTSPMGPRWGLYHWGVDYGVAGGSGGKPIYAIKDGTVIQAGAASGFGQWIRIDHPASVGGNESVYGHIIPEVREGQQVREGQRIGRINPNSATNGGVAPHLHIEVYKYSWVGPGQRVVGQTILDPQQVLRGAKWPGESTARPVGKRDGTIFGVDVSSHQDGMSLKRAASEGIDFAIIRTTDGTYKDRCYRSHLDDAESAGLITAAYHYLRNPSEGTTIAQQVQAALEVMGDKKRPMWLDCETPAGLHVDHIREAKREFERRGVRVIGAYSYVPYWEGSIAPGEPDSHEFGAFWVAAHGSNRTGTPANIYPGDSASQWDYPLGNQKPALWQYGSNAQVAGYNVDINAYRGSRDELRALFYGGKQHHEGEEMTTKFFTDFLTGYLGPQIKAIQEIWTQLRGPGGKGWEQLGQNAQGQNLTPVDALAAIRQQLAQIQADVNGIKRGKK